MPSRYAILCAVSLALPLNPSAAFAAYEKDPVIAIAADEVAKFIAQSEEPLPAGCQWVDITKKAKVRVSRGKLTYFDVYKKICKLTQTLDNR